MWVTVETSYPQVCRELMDQYCHLFAQKPIDDKRDDSIIWYVFPDDTLQPYWHEWATSAKRLGLIYDWSIR